MVKILFDNGEKILLGISVLCFVLVGLSVLLYNLARTSEVEDFSFVFGLFSGFIGLMFLVVSLVAAHSHHDTIAAKQNLIDRYPGLAIEAVNLKFDSVQYNDSGKECIGTFEIAGSTNTITTAKCAVDNVPKPQNSN